MHVVIRSSHLSSVDPFYCVLSYVAFDRPIMKCRQCNWDTAFYVSTTLCSTVVMMLPLSKTSNDLEFLLECGRSWVGGSQLPTYSGIGVCSVFICQGSGTGQQRVRFVPTRTKPVHRTGVISSLSYPSNQVSSQSKPNKVAANVWNLIEFFPSSRSRYIRQQLVGSSMLVVGRQALQVMTYIIHVTTLLLLCTLCMYACSYVC